MDVNFGLNDLGRIKYMMDMATMLQLKKKAETQIKDNPDKRDELQAKIDDLNKKALDKLKQMEEYAKAHKQKGVVAYV